MASPVKSPTSPAVLVAVSLKMLRSALTSPGPSRKTLPFALSITLAFTSHLSRPCGPSSGADPFRSSSNRAIASPRPSNASGGSAIDSPRFSNERGGGAKQVFTGSNNASQRPRREVYCMNGQLDAPYSINLPTSKVPPPISLLCATTM